MCGILGATNNSREAASDLYFGLFALQHRGKESAGIVTYDGNQYYSQLGMGEIPAVFKDESLKKLAGKIGIAHNRYSTTAGSNPENIQPIKGFWRDEEFWLAHNGNLINTEILREKCLERGRTPYASSDTGVIVTLISLSSAPSFIEAVKETVDQLRGAFSLVILYKNRLIVVRDGLGIRPLHLGKRGDDWVVASETSALHLLGAASVREIDPGEILIIDQTGITEYYHPKVLQRKFCIFEFIYFLRPDSLVLGRRAKSVQKNMGRFLAREHPAEADLVIGIPDSAKYGGSGFIEVSGIKNGDEALFRPHLISRTFIEPVKELRERAVDLKFVPFEEEIAGKKLVVVDDSIVRGTTTKKLVERFREAGAKEVHERIYSPPYRFPCYYGIDTYRVDDELIARKHDGDIDKIRQELGLDSLEYLSLESVIRAIIEIPGDVLTANDFCTACFSGEYPVPPLVRG